MRIILFECKKALLSPIIVCLLLLFTGWNIFIIYNASDFKEELPIVNELAGKYGARYTDALLATLDNEITTEVAQMNTITEKKTSQTFAGADDFFDQLTFEEQGRYTEKELDTFYDLFLKEMYRSAAASMDESYAGFDIQKIGESEITKFGLTGSAAETLRKEYEAFADRFATLQQNGEHRSWFFSGQNYHMHSLLFSTVFRHLVIEGMILVVLATALITNFEFEHRNQLVAYTTRRGRTLMADKLVASLLTILAIIIFLSVVTLGTYFTVFDYAHLWKTAISSGFNWENNFPYVSWWNWSFLTYFLMSLVLLFICMLLFSLFTFSISVLVKNSYFTFIIFASLFIAFFLIPGFIPNSTNFMLMSGYTLSTLVLNPHQWWMGTGGLAMFKNYEWMTITVWTIILIALCGFSFKKFARQDIS